MVSAEMRKEIERRLPELEKEFIVLRARVLSEMDVFRMTLERELLEEVHRSWDRLERLVSREIYGEKTLMKVMGELHSLRRMKEMGMR